MKTTLTLNGKELATSISVEEFEKAYSELVRLLRANFPSQDRQLMSRLNSEATTRIYEMEKAIDEQLFWLQDLAFKRGISLEEGK